MLTLLVGLFQFIPGTSVEAAGIIVPNNSFETLSGGFTVNWTRPHANGYESSSITRAYMGSALLNAKIL